MAKATGAKAQAPIQTEIPQADQSTNLNAKSEEQNPAIQAPKVEAEPTLQEQIDSANAEVSEAKSKIDSLTSERAAVGKVIMTAEFGSEESEKALNDLRQLDDNIRKENVALAKAESNISKFDEALENKALLDKVAEGDKEAYEAVLKMISKPTPASRKSSRSTGGNRGDKSREILEAFLENKANGMSDTENKKQLVAAGFKVGTVGSTVLQWERDNGIKEAKA